jgi:hypothetical protein
MIDHNTPGRSEMQSGSSTPTTNPPEQLKQLVADLQSLLSLLLIGSPLWLRALTSIVVALLGRLANFWLESWAKEHGSSSTPN